MESKFIDDAKQYVNKLLLPLDWLLYYHTYQHALEVMQRAMYLGKKEWLSDEEIEMLGLAWLFHDTWFIVQYDDNEPIWAKVAENYLKSVLYFPENNINKIQEIILATAPSKKPKNIYEEIIKDADIDNLWRDDFFEKNNDLKKEVEAIKNIKIKDPDWIHASLSTLDKFNFSTKFQKQEREQKKLDNIKKLQEKLEKE